MPNSLELLIAMVKENKFEAVDVFKALDYEIIGIVEDDVYRKNDDGTVGKTLEGYNETITIKKEFR